MLVHFYGLNRKRDLLAYSLAGTKFSEKEIIAQYVKLLERIRSGKLKVGKPQAIIDSLLCRFPHVFRQGTLSVSGKAAHDRIKTKMLKLIKDCKDDADRLAAKIAAGDPTTGDVNDPHMLLGKSVLVSGTHWGEPGVWYNGVVQSYAPKRPGLKTKYYHCKYVKLNPNPNPLTLTRSLTHTRTGGVMDRWITGRGMSSSLMLSMRHLLPLTSTMVARLKGRTPNIRYVTHTPSTPHTHTHASPTHTLTP